jgi:transposase-like protein
VPLLAVRHIQDFHRRFRTNDACLEFLFALRFADVACPHCGRKNAYHKGTIKPRFMCNCGRSQIYPCKGTLFENSPLPLMKWFYALFLLWSKQGDVTAMQLHREIHVTYATAWRMMKRMQSAIEESELGDDYGWFESFLASVAKGR